MERSPVYGVWSLAALHLPQLAFPTTDRPFLLRQDLTPQMGSSCNADGALCFEYWPDEAQPHPSFVYIKGGLKPTKC